MKLKTLFITAAVTLAMSTSVFAKDVTVSLNGRAVSFPNQQPVIVEGRTLIPLRGLFDNMGYSISWNGNTKTVTLSKGSDTITINIGESCYYLNGSKKAIDVPAQIINSSTMLPLRAIADATGAQVLWDGSTKTVSISYGGSQSAEGGWVTLNSQAEADYLDSYNKIMGDYSSSLGELASAQNSLKNADLDNKNELKAIAAGYEDVRIASENAKTKLAALDCPAKFANMHSAAAAYIDSIGNMCKIIPDFVNGNIDETELEAKFNSASADAALKEAAYVKAFNETAD